MSIKIKLVFFLLLTLTLLGCDRVSKDMAKKELKGRGTISYLDDTFRLDYAENTGAFLSFGDNFPKPAAYGLFVVAPFIFLIGLFAYTIKKIKEWHYLKLFSIALIFSGGLGNIIDRVFFDLRVTDFLNMGIMGLRTGIFNFADFYVTTGVTLLLISMMKRFEKEKEEENSQ